MFNMTAGGLISCVMATGNRPRFFRQALRCFARQTYPNRELIVVDDGQPPVEEMCGGIDNVRYIRTGSPAPAGTKLNLAIEAARGEILQKLDDDDYYHPEFLATAAAHLPAEQQESTLVAWDCFLIAIAGEKRLRYSGYGWRAGGTFCFSKQMWRRKPFRDISRSEDSWFAHDHQPAIVRVREPERYILVRHGGNSWTQMQGGLDADQFLATLQEYPRSMEEVMADPEDVKFYRSL